MTQGPDPHRGAPRRATPAFRARGTLGLLYFVGFFFLISLLMILPELIDLLGNPPATPADEQALERAAQEIGHRGVDVYLAAALALAATALGAWLQVLPGMRER